MSGRNPQWQKKAVDVFKELHGLSLDEATTALKRVWQINDIRAEATAFLGRGQQLPDQFTDRFIEQFCQLAPHIAAVWLKRQLLESADVDDRRFLETHIRATVEDDPLNGWFSILISQRRINEQQDTYNALIFTTSSPAQALALFAEEFSSRNWNLTGLHTPWPIDLFDEQLSSFVKTIVNAVESCKLRRHSFSNRKTSSSSELSDLAINLTKRPSSALEENELIEQAYEYLINFDDDLDISQLKALLYQQVLEQVSHETAALCRELLESLGAQAKLPLGFSAADSYRDKKALNTLEDPGVQREIALKYLEESTEFSSVVPKDQVQGHLESAIAWLEKNGVIDPQTDGAWKKNGFEGEFDNYEFLVYVYSALVSQGEFLKVFYSK
jgi:hypothetical protein